MRETVRWAHWSFGVGAAMLLVGFGWMIAATLAGWVDYGRGIRIVVPGYVLSCYWLLAVILNRRTVTLGPEGLRMAISPIPVKEEVRIDRSEIRCCYMRVEIPVSDDEVAVPGPPYYVAGVESRQGRQIMLRGPYDARRAGMAAAGELARMVDAGGAVPVEVRDGYDYVPGIRVSRVLLVAAAYIVSILVGAWWEVSAGGF